MACPAGGSDKVLVRKLLNASQAVFLAGVDPWVYASFFVPKTEPLPQVSGLRRFLTNPPHKRFSAQLPSRSYRLVQHRILYFCLRLGGRGYMRDLAAESLEQRYQLAGERQNGFRAR